MQVCTYMCLDLSTCVFLCVVVYVPMCISVFCVCDIVKKCWCLLVHRCVNLSISHSLHYSPNYLHSVSYLVTHLVICPVCLILHQCNICCMKILTGACACVHSCEYWRFWIMWLDFQQLIEIKLWQRPLSSEIQNYHPFIFQALRLLIFWSSLLHKH